MYKNMESCEKRDKIKNYLRKCKKMIKSLKLKKKNE